MKQMPRYARPADHAFVCRAAQIVAVDISRTAWDEFVERDGESPLPSGVSFTQANDDAYLESFLSRGPEAEGFDMVVVNYAINPEKANELARALLTAEGRLLAPVNIQRDYWFAQEFRLMDRSGTVLWRQRDVGAWQVTFQPDFTEPSCQGQWCPQFRGPDSMSTLQLGKTRR